MGVRFAPSPTGTFHLGNLRTAWISHALARRLGRPWAVRFEDIDTPRVVPGAMERQLEDMAALGLRPDEIRIQSGSRSRHWELFLRARAAGKIYPCTCSRKEVARDIASAPHALLPLYSGKCRNEPGRVDPRHETLAWRFRNTDPSGAEDFIIARSGGLSVDGTLEERAFVPSYNWACAIDDLDGRYALIVRCMDLFPVAAQQYAIQRWIDPSVPLPAVFHTALVVGMGGKRLEKRTQGVTWRELLAQGWSAAALVERFQSSFSASVDSDLKPGALFQETLGKITVDQILDPHPGS